MGKAVTVTVTKCLGINRLGINDKIAKLVVQVVVTVANYVFSKIFVFRGE